MKWQVVTTIEDLRASITDWAGAWAVDTETYGKLWSTDAKLLGISISPEHTTLVHSIYIPVWVFENGTWNYTLSDELKDFLPSLLADRLLVGHSFSYDESVLRILLNLHTRWHADTRIMWHLASAPAGPRPYGLEELETEVLGWKENSKKAFATHLKARGGNVDNGDHYKAAFDELAKYACLDTYATIQGYIKFKPFFDMYEYWWMLHKAMAYSNLLEANTVQGVLTDKEGLSRAHQRLLNTKEAALRRFFKLVKEPTSELEEDWKDRRKAEYKREYNKVHYENNPQKWKRFNLNSDPDKRELFYGKLGLPVTEYTKGGKTDKGRKRTRLASTSADAIKHSSGLVTGPRRVDIQEIVSAYLKYEKANTISTSFSGPYLDSIGLDSRLHPGFNICGTVSYRLSGFKPYLLNAPFDEKAVLKHLKCDPGYIGVHADLTAIEPTITAHYSEDPSLLKVFRDGLGDIYLDLATELFPNDKEIQSDYCTLAPITKAVKVRFDRQRKIAKFIHLAVSYTGTGHAVSKNLSRDGEPTTVPQAEDYVRAYWRKFKAVEALSRRLTELNRRQGYLRNVIGRIIRVPSPDYKDLFNRFIQSSGHDVLVLWVLAIYRMCAERGIRIKPILLDCHDSTSNQVPEEQVEQLEQVYRDALEEVNEELGLCVKIKMEMKRFTTLAGLKADE